LHKAHAAENSIAFLGNGAQEQPLDRHAVRSATIHSLFNHFAVAYLPGWSVGSREMCPNFHAVTGVCVEHSLWRNKRPVCSVPPIDLHAHSKHVIDGFVIVADSDAIANQRQVWNILVAGGVRREGRGCT
jgi:hypothetical protein